MFKWQKQEHTDIFITSKLDAKEKGDTQNLTQNVFLKNLNIEGKVDSYFKTSSSSIYLVMISLSLANWLFGIKLIIG